MDLTHKQVSALGGKKRWNRITKKKRSEIMRQVALARYKSFTK